MTTTRRQDREHELPVGVQKVIEATNAGDSEAFLAAFTHDGVVVDHERTFTGHAEIARWNDDENIGVHAHFDIEGTQRTGNTTTVRLAVSGDGYNGASTFAFETDGNRVRSMRISG
jgi:ketosteroid isomerase-like protein